MTVFRMSEVGICQRALTAQRLGYDPLPRDKASELIMRESRRHQDWVIEDMRAQGLEVVYLNDVCGQCAMEFGDAREGEHAEVSQDGIRVVGHLDCRVKVDVWRVDEIKALGRFTFQKLLKEGPSAFPEYLAQLTAQMIATQLPGRLTFKCRDTGEVKHWDYPYPSDGVHQAMWEKLTRVEKSVDKGALPECEMAEDSPQRRYCSFRYLCGEAQAIKEALPVTTDVSLLDAANLWAEGKVLELQAQERLEQAKQVFLIHVKETGECKFQAGQVSVQYLGEQRREHYDTKTLKQLVSEDVLVKALRVGKAWDDIRIRVVK